MRGSSFPANGTTVFPITFCALSIFLLVTAMVATPMVCGSRRPDLPSTNRPEIGHETPWDVTLTLDAASDVYLENKWFPAGTLGDGLALVARSRPERRIVVRADRRLEYGQVLLAIKAVSRAGFRRVFLETKPVNPVADVGRLFGGARRQVHTDE
jgi:biopolymer transport protein TolR